MSSPAALALCCLLAAVLQRLIRLGGKKEPRNPPASAWQPRLQVPLLSPQSVGGKVRLGLHAKATRLRACQRAIPARDNAPSPVPRILTSLQASIPGMCCIRSPPLAALPQPEPRRQARLLRPTATPGAHKHAGLLPSAGDLRGPAPAHAAAAAHRRAFLRSHSTAWHRAASPGIAQHCAASHIICGLPLIFLS